MGRGSASASASSSAVAAAALVMMCLMAFHCDMANAAVYTVNWSFNSGGWPRGKSFRAGDVIVFRYSPALHNLVTVSGPGYNGCTTPRGSKVFTSGADRITLRRGTNFFLCSIPGHCSAGMKMAVTAA